MSGAIGLCLLFALYFLPAILARHREHPNVTSIVVVNAFLGWTFLGWVLALAWAVGPVRRSS